MRSLLFILVLIMTVGTACQAATLPGPTIGDGLGVNIHFRGNQPGELDLIRDAGFKFIRMDFAWDAVEKQKGAYDFSEYDPLVEGLTKRGMRALFILDYGNSLYDLTGANAVEGRQAFARFASVAVQRYRDKNIVWELWNEPDGMGFPQPSQPYYIELAKVVLPAIHRADPNAVCIAPAVSYFDFDWLEKCFKGGLLNMIDALSLHPYRGNASPETVLKDWPKMRLLMAKYRPGKPALPVVSSEWGYSDAQPKLSQKRQGEFIARMFLSSASAGIPLSIWYDWKDDGSDPNNREHHFGTIKTDNTPKPAYLAVQKLSRELAGMHFIKRMESRLDDYLMLFGDGKNLKIAAWTTVEPHKVEVSREKTIDLTTTPEYYPVIPDDRSVISEASWQVVVKRENVLSGVFERDPLAPAFTVHVSNPFAKSVLVGIDVSSTAEIRGSLVGTSEFSLKPGESRDVKWQGRAIRRDQRELRVPVAVSVDGVVSRQRISFSNINPVSFGIEPDRDGGLSVSMSDSLCKGFHGIVKTRVGSSFLLIKLRADDGWKNVSASGPKGTIPTSVGEDGKLRITLSKEADPQAEVSAVLEVDGGVVAYTGIVSMVRPALTTSSATAVEDGDPKVGVRFHMEDNSAEKSVSLQFDYDKGWKQVRICPKTALPIFGTPHEAGIWVKGDGSGLFVNMRYVDATGKTFQPKIGVLDFSGWRYLKCRLDDPSVTCWGDNGADGKITYPIRLDSFVLFDSTGNRTKGLVEMKDFALFYRK